MKISGKVFMIFPLNRVSDKFRKREFVLEYADNPMYPQFVLFQATNKKIEILDNVKNGDHIEVEFNLRGREWIAPSGEKKYFNTLEAWRITPLQTETQPTKAPELTLADLEVSEEDLPF